MNRGTIAIGNGFVSAGTGLLMARALRGSATWEVALAVGTSVALIQSLTLIALRAEWRSRPPAGPRPPASHRLRGPRNYAAERMAASRIYAQLWSLLDEQNRVRLARGEPLRITGSQGGEYLVKEGITENVVGLNKFGQLITFCAYVPTSAVHSNLRNYMTMAAQVLLLTTDERRFREIAIQGRRIQ